MRFRSKSCQFSVSYSMKAAVPVALARHRGAVCADRWTAQRTSGLSPEVLDSERLGPGQTSDLIRSVSRAPVGVNCQASLAFKAAAATRGRRRRSPLGRSFSQTESSASRLSPGALETRCPPQLDSERRITQLSAADHSARESMKDAAKCVN